MASIKRRPERGNRWQATYKGPDGRERAKMFDRKVDAERWVAQAQADLSRGTYIDPGAGRQTFGEYAGKWQAAQVHRSTTAAQVQSHLENHILPFFKDRRVSSVRSGDVQSWVKDRSTKLAPATVEVAYRFVASIFRAAVADRLIPSTPCVNIRLPRIPPREVVPLDVGQVQDLIAAVSDRYRALIVAAAGTGMRQGELFGLTVERLDLGRRSIRVEEQLQVLAGAPPFMAPPKTAASYRTIPLPTVVADALKGHVVDYPVTNELGLVFTNAAGLPIRRGGFYEGCWRPAITRAKLPSGTHFHQLRHFYASLLIRHGESVKVVQSRLGHASARETLDTYSHLWPDSEDTTRSAVDGVLGTATAPSSPPGTLF